MVIGGEVDHGRGPVVVIDASTEPPMVIGGEGRTIGPSFSTFSQLQRSRRW